MGKLCPELECPYESISDEHVSGVMWTKRVQAMGILMKLLQYIMEKQSDRILWAIEKVNTGGTVEDIDVIVRDYLYLIRKTYKGPEIQKITLTNNPYLIYINGVEYDFDVLIRHNNQRGTECKMEIEALLHAGLRDEVERRLNAEF